jgi:hypothetical protein
VVLARPSDGAVLVLEGAAATVWLLLERPMDRDELVARLLTIVPGAASDSLDSVLDSVLDNALVLLGQEGLLDP